MTFYFSESIKDKAWKNYSYVIEYKCYKYWHCKRCPWGAEEERYSSTVLAFHIKITQNIISKFAGSKLHFNMVFRFIRIIERKRNKTINLTKIGRNGRVKRGDVWVSYLSHL